MPMQLSPSDRIVIVSPHLDDAAFSCGGLIVTAKESGSYVSVITVFSASPAKEPSPFARIIAGDSLQIARDWMQARRSEDQKALSVQNAKAIHLPFEDSIFRRDRQDLPYYSSWPQVFGEINEQDEFELSRHRDRIYQEILKERPTHVLFPLGIGNHVDHVLVRRMGENLEFTDPVKKIWYEELPYASVSRSHADQNSLKLEFDLAQKRGLIIMYQNGLGTSDNREEMIEQILRHNHENYISSDSAFPSPG